MGARGKQIGSIFQLYDYSDDCNLQENALEFRALALDSLQNTLDDLKQAHSNIASAACAQLYTTKLTAADAASHVR